MTWGKRYLRVSMMVLSQTVANSVQLVMINRLARDSSAAPPPTPTLPRKGRGLGGGVQTRVDATLLLRYGSTRLSQPGDARTNAVAWGKHRNANPFSGPAGPGISGDG